LSRWCRRDTHRLLRRPACWRPHRTFERPVCRSGIRTSRHHGKIYSVFWGGWEGKNSIVGVFSFFEAGEHTEVWKVKYGVIMAKIPSAIAAAQKSQRKQ
jgi:hypothetical protein